jgi:hypothetical protein
MGAYNHAQWSNLVGADVEIRKGNQIIRTGTVDATMSDSSALRIAATGNQPRILIPASDDDEVWVEPRQLEGTRSYRMSGSALHRTTPEENRR